MLNIADWLAERVGFELTGDFVADQARKFNNLPVIAPE
jgi:hypothetical protein